MGIARLYTILNVFCLGWLNARTDIIYVIIRMENNNSGNNDVNNGEPDHNPRNNLIKFREDFQLYPPGGRANVADQPIGEEEDGMHIPDDGLYIPMNNTYVDHTTENDHTYKLKTHILKKIRDQIHRVTGRVYKRSYESTVNGYNAIVFCKRFFDGDIYIQFIKIGGEYYTRIFRGRFDDDTIPNIIKISKKVLIPASQKSLSSIIKTKRRNQVLREEMEKKRGIVADIGEGPVNIIARYAGFGPKSRKTRKNRKSRRSRK
jgi:hypothetical protein